jgi:hypothetical protein
MLSAPEKAPADRVAQALWLTAGRRYQPIKFGINQHGHFGKEIV